MARLLIAGLGSIGQRHLRNLLDLGERDIILYRRSPDSLPYAPDVPVLTDLVAALSLEPDIVLVTNPTAQHLDVALPAARSGCNLFIEKPISHTWDGVDELLDVIEQQQLLTIVGFDLRFDPGLQKIKELLERGCVGQVVSIQSQVGQYLPDWRPSQDYRTSMSAHKATGGGVILDLIHELDYVTWLLGPVSRVSCFARRVSSLDIETEDTAVLVLHFASGCLGSIHLDYIQRAPSRTCKIIGEKGTITWDYFMNRVSWFEVDSQQWDTFEYPHFDRNSRFKAEMKHLLACLAGTEVPKVNAVAGSRVLKLALAAKESAATGRVCLIE